MHLIVNPAAAGGRLGRAWPRLHEQLRQLGFDPPLSFTKAPGHATDLAADAVAKGAEVVVVAGGDGTICEAVQGLHDAGRGVLAILPLGTGNDAARTLRVPLTLEAAVKTIQAGARRRVDLMKVGDRVVLNAVGIGLLGYINIKATSMKVVRGITAYLVAALGSLTAYRGPRVTLRGDDAAYEGSMLILAVHNGPTTGGGFRLTPDAVPDDRQLDACLVEDIGILGRLPRLAAAMRGTLGEWPGSHNMRFTRLELLTDERLPAHRDGNAYYVDPPGTTFEALPAALEVITPKL